MLKSNQHYFKHSVNNPETLDTRYMFLEWDKDIEKYVKTTKKLKELLATIKILNAKKQNAENIYEDLYKLLVSKFASKSELNCFINACDSTISTIKNDLKSFKYIVDLYLKHRDFTEITPKEWIQAIIDKGASRGKGSVGEDKLIEIAIKEGFSFVDSWDNFTKSAKSVAKFSKNNFDMQHIKTRLGIELKFNSQNKMLDVILKKDNKYLFIEAKHLKEDGGSQDKQIKELIGIIQHNAHNDNVLYGAFLDGVYSNVLLNLTDNDIEKPNEKNYGTNKVLSQQIDITKALAKNKNSFWYNTAGFVEFVKDFSK